MVDIQIWKIISDVLLVGSLIYLSYKIAKGYTAPLEKRAQGLQTSLKMLLDEAESSSKHLNEKLLRRQTELQKSLSDLKSFEDKIEGSTTKGESIELRLKEQLRKAKSQNEELALKKEELEILIGRIEEVSTSVSRQNTNSKKTTINENEEPIVEVNFESTESIVSTLNDIEKEETAKIKKDKVINKPAEDNNLQNSQIEKEKRLDYQGRETKRKPEQGRLDKNSNSEVQGIQEIYDAAENLLKAGKDINYVAKNTTLSLEEVSMLAEMVEREEGIQNFKSDDIETDVLKSDPRLGVLGKMSRKDIQL